MIRFAVMFVILLLVLMLVRTFMSNSSRERPIDVDPVKTSSNRGKDEPADDDIIDVEPID